MRSGAKFEGLILKLRVTPGASRNALEGLWTGADGRSYIRARVTAPPQEGEANDSVARLIARALGVPKGKVQIVKGMASREKTIEVQGDAAVLTARLGALIAKAGEPR